MLACNATEVLIASIAAVTQRIRSAATA